MSDQRASSRHLTSAVGLRLATDERGAGLIRTAITLLVVVTVLYGALKFIPVRAAAFQFDDAVREQVILAGARRRRVTEQQMRQLLVKRAEELGLPVTGRDIVVRQSRETVRIEIDYAVPIELVFGYVYEWNFDVEYEGPSF